MPLLSTNEVLRTRRVCSWIKGLATDHLWRHPGRSKVCACLVVPNAEYPGREYFIRVVKEDLASIGAEMGAMPLSRINLQVESVASYANPRLGAFITRYGYHLRHLDLYRRNNLPYSVDELRFFDKLPNLKYLNVYSIFLCHKDSLKANNGDMESRNLPLPQVFSKLTELNVSNELFGIPVWKLLETCTNLKTFGKLDHSNNDGAIEEIQSILKVFGRKHHKKLKHLDLGYWDMKHLQLDVMGYRQLMSEIYDLIINCDLKLQSVTTSFFEGMEEAQKNQFALKISSLRYDCLTNPRFPEILGAHSFPQVEDILLISECQNLDVEQVHMTITRNLPLLSSKNLPNLRILRFETPNYNCKGDGGKLLARLWSSVPTLEELEFIYVPFLHDVVFIGENGELPFLHLESEATFFFDFVILLSKYFIDTFIG